VATIHETTASDAAVPGNTDLPRGPARLRWTSDEYYRLAELGFFRDRRVELVEGDIVEMSRLKPPHAISIELADSALRAAFGPGHRIRMQLPIDLGRRSQPEPDAIVLAGSPRDYAEHPKSALLILEISDTTLRYDRVVKGHLYARASVADYWILNLVDRRLEVHRQAEQDPARRGRWIYAQRTIFSAEGHIAPLAKPDVLIAVADLLP